jgi:hypothetical protein
MENKVFGQINISEGPNAHSSHKGPIFWLPHSCDEWVIGSLEDAEDFLQNLAEAIAYAKS